jgi:DNA invertase Pin-like site-specific DNA recombinase
VNDIAEKTTPKTTVAYMRTATADRVGSRISLERQLLTCEEYAHRLGLHLSAAYVDVGASGLAENRPALDQLMFDLSRGHIRHVVIADPCRLARSRELGQRLQERIRGEGATLTMPCDARGQQSQSN